MAYSDYGAFVTCNGKRRTDKEDVAVFASDIDTFGDNVDNIPSGLRIWAHLIYKRSDKETPDYPDKDWVEYIHHGILGDGPMRVVCHKQGFPTVYYWPDDAEYPVRIEVRGGIDSWEYYNVEYEVKGYKFHFISGEPYYAEMIEPDGTDWECRYDYQYGAGFEDE